MAVHYAAHDGTDTWANSTNISTPTDIDTAFDNAIADDIVYFRGGTYQTPAADRVSYEGYWMPSNSGTSGSQIVFQAYPGEVPILSMDINDEVYLGVNPNIAQVLATGTQEYVTFDGFKCVALDDKTAGIFLGEGTPVSKKRGIICQNCEVQCGTKAIPQRDNFDAVRIEDCDGAVFTKNKIKDLVGAPPYPHHNVAALKLYDNINVIVEHNEITNCNEGIVAKRDFEDGFIRYNWVDGCVEGIHVLVTNFGNGTNSGTSIYHNLITNSTYMGIDYNADSGVTKSAEDLDIYNNTIYQQIVGTGWGMFLDECPNLDGYNNIIHGSGDQLRFSIDTTLATWDHNQLGTGTFSVTVDEGGGEYTSLAAWQSSGELIGGTDPGDGSLASNPVFVNTSGSLNQIADFALDTGSPCIGAGRSSVDMGANIALVGIQGGTNVTTTLGQVTLTPNNLSITAAGSTSVTTTTETVTLTAYDLQITLEQGVVINVPSQDAVPEVTLTAMPQSIATATQISLTTGSVTLTPQNVEIIHFSGTGGAGEEYKPEEALEPQFIEEDFIIDAHYRALKLAIYAYYGIEEELH